VTDIYLHRRHVIGSLVWELNWLSRHHVGCGLWRQGRAPAPGARPVEVREVRWEIIPSDAMPSSRHVMSVEESDICVWLIRSGCCTTDLRDAMNKTIEHVAGMRQGWPDSREARRLPVSRPRIGGPVVPTPL
jgi:hypothetical protein